ncbi:MAG: NRDE family protein [Chryseolinea sp.]
MCLIFISVQHNPAYKLIVAGNRDEFYSRPTIAADYWDDATDILAGRDLEAGGTWMGVSRAGKISMLTNYRDPQHIDPKAPSRGLLVSDFLKGDESGDDYLRKLESHGKAFNGFNLLVGDQKELWYYSNYKEGIERLSPGFYGISNKLLETAWPKVVRGKEKLQPLFKSPTLHVEEILDALYDDVRAPLDQLPDTGLTQTRELALSSMFIKTDNYGSRCSTVITIDNNDNLQFSERVYNIVDFSHQTKNFGFAIS